MNTRRINLTLRAAAAVLFVAVPVVVVAGFFARLDSDDAVPTHAVAVRPSTQPSGHSVSLQSFGAALDRPLRTLPGESAGPSPETPIDTAGPAVSPKQLRLVGTVGSSLALVKGPDDTVAIVEVGDDVEGADVVAIRDQQVELRQNGRLIRLEKDPPKPAGGDIVIR